MKQTIRCLKGWEKQSHYHLSVTQSVVIYSIFFIVSYLAVRHRRHFDLSYQTAIKKRTDHKHECTWWLCFRITKNAFVLWYFIKLYNFWLLYSNIRNIIMHIYDNCTYHVVALVSYMVPGTSSSYAPMYHCTYWWTLRVCHVSYTSTVHHMTNQMSICFSPWFLFCLNLASGLEVIKLFSTSSSISSFWLVEPRINLKLNQLYHLIFRCERSCIISTNHITWFSDVRRVV